MQSHMENCLLLQTIMILLILSFFCPFSKIGIKRLASVLGQIENNQLQLKEGQKWNCPTSIFLCRTNNALNLNSFYTFHSYCFFLSILFVAMFLKVYKCKRKFLSQLERSNQVFRRKHLISCQKRKTERSKALSYVWPKESSIINNTSNTLNLFLMLVNM